MSSIHYIRKERSAIDIRSRAKNFRPTNGSVVGWKKYVFNVVRNQSNSNFNYILSLNFKIINNEAGNFKSFGINNSFVSFVFFSLCKQFVSIRYQFRVKRIFFFIYKFRSIDTFSIHNNLQRVRLLSKIKKKREREREKKEGKKNVCVCKFSSPGNKRGCNATMEWSN